MATKKRGKSKKSTSYKTRKNVKSTVDSKTIKNRDVDAVEEVKKMASEEVETPKEDINIKVSKEDVETPEKRLEVIEPPLINEEPEQPVEIKEEKDETPEVEEPKKKTVADLTGAELRRFQRTGRMPE